MQSFRFHSVARRIPILPLLALLAAPVAWLNAKEIGFVEDYALADDRRQALAQLIPGTEDYYYFHCLYYQTTGQFDQVEPLLEAWTLHHGLTARAIEIRHRQHLLTYSRDPQRTLEYLRQQFNLQFNHQRQVPGARPDLPTRLDPQLIEWQHLAQQARSRQPGLQGFEDSGLWTLLGQDLKAAERREILKRVQDPDHPRLVEWILQDLRDPESPGFGAYPIHGQLTRQQLDKLLAAMPELRSQQTFVSTYISKLQPGPEVDWVRQPEELVAYLEDLWRFVEPLPNSFNSLKAHVLYHLLDVYRRQGRYDRELFLVYLQLPRAVPYASTRYLELPQNRGVTADLQADFRPLTRLRIVGDDQPLVRDYLSVFFLDAERDDIAPFTRYLDDAYVRQVFAETKILNGVGDPQQWAALLTPEQFQQLRDRVELEFAETNQRYYRADEAVSLDVFVKNVDQLLVKIYRLDAAAYYRRSSEPVHTGIDLDGLPAVEEFTQTYDLPPYRRMRRTFELPQLQRPGIYVVDLIGNGTSSRALIHKGRLTFTQEPSAAGHRFRVYDEQGNQRPDARILFGGQEFTAEDGVITIPYSNDPGRRPIILIDGDLVTLDNFQHQSEAYRLAAGIYIDREQLVRHKEATALIRPVLWLNQVRVPLEILTDLKVTVATHTQDEIASSQEFDDLELSGSSDLEVHFRVPARLASVTVTLTAKVQNLSHREEESVEASKTFVLNQISGSAEIDTPHLARSGDSYLLEVLGRTGEGQPNRVVQLELKHRDFRDPVTATLKSDDNGRIELGPLGGIDWIAASVAGQHRRQWSLRDFDYGYPTVIHARAGGPILVPYPGQEEEPDREHLALFERLGGTIVADRFDHLRVDEGLIRLEGLEAGNYELVIKTPSRRVIAVQVTNGPVESGWVVGVPRYLELAGEPALQITEVASQDGQLRVQLAGATPSTRLHLIATRYQPAYSPFDYLRVGDGQPLGALRFPGIASLLVTGRNIGDEYRYILERQQARHLPGNMLERPQLLLNPWELRTTETGRQRAQAGRGFAAESPPAEPDMAQLQAETSAVAETGDWSDLDFLADTSVVLSNLQPDEEGVVTVDLEALRGHHDLHLVAVSPTRTVYRRHSLQLPERQAVDLRMAAALDPQKHFLMQNASTVLAEGQRLALPLSTETRWEIYGGLEDVYRLLQTASGNPQLNEFQFLLDWPELDSQRQRALYAKYASHELNLFLYRKDPDFFRQVIRPYLENKRDKTFLDRWLLGEDLSAYDALWRYQQLNVAERILLGRRRPDRREAMARHIADLFELIPPNPQQDAQLFDFLLANRALSRSGQEIEQLERLTGRLHAEMLSELPAAELGRAGAGMGAAAPPPAPQSAGDKEGVELGARRADRSRALMGNGAAEFYSFADDDAVDGKIVLGLRTKIEQFYQALEKTKELAENNYYHVPIEQQNADLVQVDAFWHALAQADPEQPFLSSEFIRTTDSFTEMMLALAVLDLPLRSPEPKVAFSDQEVVITASGPAIVVHQQVLPAESMAQSTEILVSQNYFRQDDRFRQVQGQQEEKYVDGEFLMDVVYGCKIVVTNPTATARSISVLVQVPQGAVPLGGAKYTRSIPLRLEPYQAYPIEYLFYFPAPGDYPHYPVQVGSEARLLAAAEPTTLTVIGEPTEGDRDSWEYISQNGTPDEVLQFLRAHNLLKLDLSLIAFRMQDVRFLQQVVDLLTERHVYNDVLWSYGIRHNLPDVIQQFLKHQDGFVQQTGLWLRSPLLDIDPIARRLYQHLEYAPLVNARAHKLGSEHEIVNDRFYEQYHQWMRLLSYKPRLDDQDRLTTTYYLFLQDRVPEALEMFATVRRESVETQLQYDYVTAYTSFFTGSLDIARELAQRYADYPVDRWRDRFAEVSRQIAQIEGREVEPGELEGRKQLAEQAARQPAFDLAMRDGSLVVTYQNLDRLQINFYKMGVELLFSRQPFSQQQGETFSIVQPNVSLTVDLPPDQQVLSIDLPEELRGAHLYIEATGRGRTSGLVHYANNLIVQISDSYGELKVTDVENQRALPATYVKVYARMKDGSVQFYKDGYTDLRGRFDYVTLSTNQLDYVDRLAILILSPTHGAAVREVEPPAR